MAEVMMQEKAKSCCLASDCDAASSSGSFEMSQADLVRLLSYLEGELQARDVILTTLRQNAARKQLGRARYGRLGVLTNCLTVDDDDPFSALQRDVEIIGDVENKKRSDIEDDGRSSTPSSVQAVYEGQLTQLEKLIAVQRRAHLRAKQVLSIAEKRHAKTVQELESEKLRRKLDSEQSDDLCVLLEKEREKLKEEIECYKQDQTKLKNEISRLQRLMDEEKERRKQIVLCLLQDRRKLAILFAEERQKNQNLIKEFETFKIQRTSHCSSCLSFQSEVEKLKENVKGLTLELESVRKTLHGEREENVRLKETIKTQENDLNLIRETIMAKSRKIQQDNKTTSINNAVVSSPPSYTVTTASRGMYGCSSGNFKADSVAISLSNVNSSSSKFSPTVQHDGDTMRRISSADSAYSQQISTSSSSSSPLRSKMSPTVISNTQRIAPPRYSSPIASSQKPPPSPLIVQSSTSTTTTTTTSDNIVTTPSRRYSATRSFALPAGNVGGSGVFSATTTFSSKLQPHGSTTTTGSSSSSNKPPFSTTPDFSVHQQNYRLHTYNCQTPNLPSSTMPPVSMGTMQNTQIYRPPTNGQRASSTGASGDGGGRQIQNFSPVSKPFMKTIKGIFGQTANCITGNKEDFEEMYNKNHCTMSNVVNENGSSSFLCIENSKAVSADETNNAKFQSFKNFIEKNNSSVLMNDNYDKIVVKLDVGSAKFTDPPVRRRPGAGGNSGGGVAAAVRSRNASGSSLLIGGARTVSSLTRAQKTKTAKLAIHGLPVSENDDDLSTLTSSSSSFCKKLEVEKLTKSCTNDIAVVVPSSVATSKFSSKLQRRTAVVPCSTVGGGVSNHLRQRSLDRRRPMTHENANNINGDAVAG